MSSNELELLAPARDISVGRIAILAGADAVYIGAPSFGARAAAGNSVDDIASLCAFAHRFRAKVYVTMNTILFDNELAPARDLVFRLYAAGVDALIVQDMAYLEMDLPPIALHASTQCDIRTCEKAARLARAGFSQLVLPRELTVDEIKAMREAAGVPVEVFVHGALCVSYSGDCQAGCIAMDRSANRGVCPQMCRLEYDIVDANMHSIAPRRHYLSLRDLNRLEYLEELIDAGASSFKIEGRLKDARYVANVTAAYSHRLDNICADSNGKYRRSSLGHSHYAFTPDVNRTFNRGYTTYFIKGKAGKMASLETPKWAGIPVGKTVTSYDSRSKSVKIDSAAELSNGDGLCYFNSSGKFCGFRLNRVDGNILYPAQPLADLYAGTTIYRNNDKAFFDILDRQDASCERKIKVDLTLCPIDSDRLVLIGTDERGVNAEHIFESPHTDARSPQEETRRRTLEKTGNSIYSVTNITDKCGMRFVPASVLSEARRKLVELLDICAESTYIYARRKPSRLNADAFANSAPLTYHDNIANSLAAKFYISHGAKIAEQAAEVKKPDGDVVVMNTRYCLRRELGACLKEKNAYKLPRELYLRNESGIYRLVFDCSRCGMSVVKCHQSNRK